jgi:hypothetical protein
MNEIWIFAFGLLAFLLAIGPLAVAAYLDYKESKEE